MRWVLLLALLVHGDTLTGKWVGPMEMTVQGPQKMRGAVPTDVELTQTGDQISGFWRSRPPNTSSGTISGTVSKPHIVFYADGIRPDGSEVAPERCQATIDATGRMTPANIYRLEAKRMTPDARAHKDCGPWPTDLVWLLQRH